MALDKSTYGANSNIYKYTASMKYVLGDTVIDIDALQMRSIAIDSNYKSMNMPMIFVTASVHKDHRDLMEENQNEGLFILTIKRAISNSDMPNLYMDYIEDKFIYFIAKDQSGNSSHSATENHEANFYDDDREDLYRMISLGLLSVDHINKNKKAINGVVTGGLSSIMYYLTSHLPILIEPPSNNVEIENQFLPPMNSVSKSLQYLNSLSVFYNTPYRFFIDFDCSYLISSSGDSIKKKGEDIGTIFITLRDNKTDSSSKVQGMTINKEKSMYQMDVDDSDCEIVDNHISGKSYSKLTATGTSGNTFNKTVTDLTGSNIVDKTKTIRVSNDNSGLLDNMISSLNTSAVQLLIQKTDVDASVFTMNKEYIIQSDDVYDEAKYNGRYLLTRKRELYIKMDENFTMDIMLLFEKLPDEK